MNKIKKLIIYPIGVSIIILTILFINWMLTVTIGYIVPPKLWFVETVFLTLLYFISFVGAIHLSFMFCMDEEIFDKKNKLENQTYEG